MSPNILEVILSSNSNNCCLLYFNANIMCSFTKKASASGGGDFVPQTIGDSSLDPTGGLPSPDPQSSFMSPNNSVRSTPLIMGEATGFIVGKGHMGSGRVWGAAYPLIQCGYG